MTWYKHILSLVSVAFLLLSTAASATAQTTIVNAGQTTELSVVNVPGITYTWELYNDVAGLNLAEIPGNCPPTSAAFVGGVSTGATVQVTWLEPGTYFYKATATSECTNNLKIGIIIVQEQLPLATIDPPGDICEGDLGELVVNLTGEAPWSLVLSDGTNLTTYDNITASPFVIPVKPKTTTSYTITEVTDVNGQTTDPSNTVTITVYPRPSISPIYQYSAAKK